MNQFIKMILFFSFLIQYQFSYAHVPPDLTEGDDYSFRLGRNNSFRFLKYMSDRTQGIGWSKFLIIEDAQGQSKLIFQNHQKFPYHKDLIKKYPAWSEFTDQQIEAITMNETGRKVMTGVLVLTKDSGQSWDMNYELISNDMISVAKTKEYQDLIKSRIDDLRTLSYYPSYRIRSQVYEKLSEFNQSGIEVIRPEPGDQPEVYTQGWARGVLLKVALADLDQMVMNQQIKPWNILLMDEAPLNPPAVAGLIVSQPSSPWSHTALLMASLGGIYFYEKNAWTNETYDSLSRTGSWVLVDAKQGYRHQISMLSNLSARDHETLKELKPGPKTIDPTVNVSDCRILPLSRRHKNDASVIGAKAANMAFMSEIAGEDDHLPDHPIALPFCYYERYIQAARISPEMTLKQFIEQKNIEIREAQSVSQKLILLESVQSAIESAIIPETILEDVRLAIVKHFPDAVSGQPIRLRSSSSVEDGAFFNGAGLYTSKTVRLTNQGELAKDLKKVWASLFRRQAWQARQAFIVDESKLSMAILIHPSMKGELAKGVSVFHMSKDQKGDDLFTMTLSGFPGEDLNVTNPPVGLIPEQTKVAEKKSYQGQYQITVSKISHSTEIPAGQNLLKDQEYKALYQSLKKYYLAWIRNYGQAPAGLDFEWDLMPSSDGKRSMVVTQVRPIPAIETDQAAGWVNAMGSTQFSTDFFELPWSMFVLKNYRSITPVIDGFFLSTDELKKPVIKKLILTSQDGSTETLGPDKFSTELSTGDWKQEYDYHLETQLLARTFKIKISVPDVRFYGMTLHMSYRDTKNLDGALMNPVSLADPDTHFTFDRDLFPWPEEEFPQPGESLYTRAKLATTSAMIRIPEPIEYFDQEIKYYKGHDITSNSDIQIDMKSRYSVAMMQKTTFQTMNEARITGLTSEPLTLSSPLAMVYAPAHHNFTYEYALDLWQAEALSEQSAAELTAKGVRYLVIRGESWPGLTGNGRAGFIGYDDQGSRKSLGEAAWTFNATEIPGPSNDDTLK